MSICIHNDYSSNVAELVDNAAREAQNCIMKQLNLLIDRGILVVKTGPGILIRSSESNKVTFNQTVELELHNEEYVKELEEKIGKLEERITKYEKILEEIRTIDM